MLTRVHRKNRDHDQGFTLIELLVVITIIGILSAIAIPVFLSQRKKAVDASMKSDLKNTATKLETYYVYNQLYPASQTFSSGVNALGSDSVIVSPGSTLTYKLYASGAYCILAANPNGSQPWVYQSDQGGQQGTATTVCP